MVLSPPLNFGELCRSGRHVVYSKVRHLRDKNFECVLLQLLTGRVFSNAISQRIWPAETFNARYLPATTTTHFAAAADCVPPNGVAYGASRFLDAVGLPSRGVHETRNRRAVSLAADFPALSIDVRSAIFRPYDPHG